MGDRTPSADPDVCVVGAGPAGALVAYDLARRGHDVVVLEAGERFSMSARRERMARELRPGHDHLSVWDMGGSRDAYSTSGPTGYAVNRLRAKGVGGSTLHWNGRVARFPEKDFEMETRYGLAADWPIGYDDLKPYYARAEREFGVSGADDNPFGPPREEPYPMAAFPPSYSDGLFADACDRLGVVTHSVPNAINSERRDGRSRCQGYGTCIPVCPSGARYSADVHVRKAEAEGARVVDRAVVQRLEHDAGGDRVTAAVYRTPDGAAHRQAARAFVLAAGGVETPRLLLLSATADHPDGLANASGAVGRYFMDHPYVGVTVRTDEPTGQHRVGFDTMESYQFYEPAEPPPGSFKLEFSNNTGPRPTDVALHQRDPEGPEDVGSAVAPIAWGDELADRIADASGHHLTVAAELEVLPDPSNRVTLDPGTTDAFGNPAPHVSWGAFGDYTRETMSAAIDVVEGIVDALDVSVRSRRRFRYGGVGHSAGTTRMGTDPRSSVVDGTLRTHDLENCWIAGASTFVTIGASQPTLTIAAVSLRLAEHLHASVL